MINDNSVSFDESIVQRLFTIESKYPNNIALKINNEIYSYKDLFTAAKKMAALLQNSPDKHCLILTKRSIVAYISLLAALFAGKAYVFLNGKDTIGEIEKVVKLAKSNLLITDEYNLVTAKTLNNNIASEFCYLCFNEMGILLESSFSVSNTEYITPVSVYKYAYLMFTSGSTGEPKGVPISHSNLNTFINNIIYRIKPVKEDKFSQINELTFDLSIQEIFPCWLVGACLCVLPENYLLGIDKYIKENEITYWASVPSMINLLMQLKKLKKDTFQSIRYSVFCGEALTYEAAQRWRQAVPNSVIDNLYGPTEATVAITGYIWNEQLHTETVPIGKAFENQQVRLLDSNYNPVNDGEVGEIYLSGAQVADGYWENPEATADKFNHINGERFYRTGDLAFWDNNSNLIFKGRIDDQLKINGYRIEKLDIENRIKSAINSQAVAVLPVKDSEKNHVKKLYCFFSHTDVAEDVVKKTCRQVLPDYMMPHFFLKLDQLPYNKNGKVDYKALKNLLRITEER